MVCVWLHFSRYQEQARKDIAVVTQRVHRILLDVGKVRCLWISPHLYFFPFLLLLNVHVGFYLSWAGSFFFNETWIVWEGFSFTWRARFVCVPDCWSVCLGTFMNNCTFVCLFVFLLLFAYLLDPLIIFSQQIAFQIRK